MRLIMPGWYGVANVKWLSEIHLQEDRYLGNYQARWYRSVVGVGGTGEEADPGTQWMETEITRMHLKSSIARVRKTGSAHQILGFVLNDGTPLKSVEVKIDEGPWQKATLDPANTQVLLEAVHLSMGGRHARPAHDRLARDGCGRQCAANGRRTEAKEDVPRRQLAVSAQDHNLMSRKNLFEQETVDEVVSRLDKLQPTSRREWGRWTWRK